MDSSSHKSATFAIRPFEKLKKKIERAEIVLPAKPAPPKKKEEFTEDELFSTAMHDVQVIEEYRGLACAQRARKVSDRAPACDPDGEVLAVLDEIAQGQRPIHLPDTQEYVEWANPAFRDDILQRMHEGHFSVQAFLDLHGCSVPEAEMEVADFLSDAFKKGLRCVKIIHGRGLRSTRGARIKEAVVKRLSGHYRKDIIAYVTARQCDGGLGALYVLLRRK
jgi:DNA-nicking Smr family endonuclease